MTTTSTTSSTSSTASTASTASTTSASSSTSSTNIGSSILTALNAGSGVDTGTLITQLTAAQKSSLEDNITAAQTTNAAQISATASIASDLTSFQQALQSLISGGSLTTQPTTTDSTTVGVTLISGRHIGDISSQLTVSQLAQAQTIESTGFGSSQTFGPGSVMITVGGTATEVDLTNSSNSLNDIVTAINAKSLGVTASVASDSSGNQRLVLKGTTGAANAFTVSGSGDYAAFNYSQPAATTDANGNSVPTTSTTATTSQMGLDQVAQDAILKVDGVTYQRASNVVGDVIAGVTLTLSKTGSVTIGSQRPGSSISQAVSDFVTTYNQFKAELDQATAAATSTASAGALRGNQTIRDLQNRLTKLTTTPLIATGAITTLAQLGVKTARDGTLSVDTDTLNSMVSTYPDQVEAMFNPSQSSSSSSVTITSAVGTVAAGIYSLTNLNATTDSAGASGTVDGQAMTATANILKSPTTAASAGLSVTIAAGLTNGSASLSIDLGLGGAMQMIVNAMTGTNGAITSLQSTLQTQSTTLADKLTAADAQLTVYHDRLVTQFSAMNTRVSSYKATQSYLTQQIDQWDKSSS